MKTNFMKGNPGREYVIPAVRIIFTQYRTFLCGSRGTPRLDDSWWPGAYQN